jgi:hypothetical protein
MFIQEVYSPSTIGDGSMVAVTTYDQALAATNVIDGATHMTTDRITAGALGAGGTFELTTKTPGVESTATVTFVVAGRIKNGGMLELVIAENNEMAAAPELVFTTADSGLPMVTAASATWSQASRTLIITTGSADIEEGATVVFTIQNVRSPSSVGAASTVAVTTFAEISSCDSLATIGMPQLVQLNENNSKCMNVIDGSTNIVTDKITAGALIGARSLGFPPMQPPGTPATVSFVVSGRVKNGDTFELVFHSGIYIDVVRPVVTFVAPRRGESVGGRGFEEATKTLVFRNVGLPIAAGSTVVFTISGVGTNSSSSDPVVAIVTTYDGTKTSSQHIIDGSTSIGWDTAAPTSFPTYDYSQPLEVRFELQVNNQTKAEVQSNLHLYKQALASSLGVDASLVITTIISGGGRHLVVGNRVKLLVKIKASDTQSAAALQSAAMTSTFTESLVAILHGSGVAAALEMITAVNIVDLRPLEQLSTSAPISNPTSSPTMSPTQKRSSYLHDNQALIYIIIGLAMVTAISTIAFCAGAKKSWCRSTANHSGGNRIYKVNGEVNPGGNAELGDLGNKAKLSRAELGLICNECGFRYAEPSRVDPQYPDQRFCSVCWAKYGDDGRGENGPSDRLTDLQAANLRARLQDSPRANSPQGAQRDWRSLFANYDRQAANAQPISADSLLRKLAVGPTGPAVESLLRSGGLPNSSGSLPNVTYYEVELQLKVVGGKVEGLGLIMSEQPVFAFGKPGVVVDGWKEGTVVLASHRVSLQETPSSTPGAVAGRVAVRERWPVATADALRVGDVLVALSGHDVRELEPANRQCLLQRALQAVAARSLKAPTVLLTLARGLAPVAQEALLGGPAGKAGVTAFPQRQLGGSGARKRQLEEVNLAHGQKYGGASTPRHPRGISTLSPASPPSAAPPEYPHTAARTPALPASPPSAAPAPRTLVVNPTAPLVVEV